MKPLTTTQRHALAKIRSFFLEFSKLPTVQELATLLEVTPQSASVTLNRLANAGCIRRWPGGYDFNFMVPPREG